MVYAKFHGHDVGEVVAPASANRATLLIIVEVIIAA
jgi:hypothetical protein